MRECVWTCSAFLTEALVPVVHGRVMRLRERATTEGRCESISRARVILAPLYTMEGVIFWSSRSLASLDRVYLAGRGKRTKLTQPVAKRGHMSSSRRLTRGSKCKSSTMKGHIVIESRYTSSRRLHVQASKLQIDALHRIVTVSKQGPTQDVHHLRPPYR